MSEFGDPILPLFSGATGTPYSDKTTSSSDFISPGSIYILTGLLELDEKASIRSGYTFDNMRVKSPSNSGGSVFIAAQSINNLGDISANGQSSDRNTSGAGSGGRISIFHSCWDDPDSYLIFGDKSNLSATRVMALAGARTAYNSGSLNQSDEFILAKNGSNKLVNPPSHIQYTLYFWRRIRMY